MEIKWNIENPAGVFILPNEVVDKHLRLAGMMQLKVLLWLARTGKRDFDPEECAAGIGQPAAVCEDAMQYWLQTGVLSWVGAPYCDLAEKPVPDVQEKEPAVPVQGLETVDTREKVATDRKEPTGRTAQLKTPNLPAVQKTAEQPAMQPRPAQPVHARGTGVKPQMQEVLAEERRSSAFAYLLQTASARLGKAISPGDMQTLLYLKRDVGLPAEVILMVIEYAIGKNKASMRYIESVALSWADQGIDTMAAVEQHLLQEKRREQAWKTVCDLLGVELSGTMGQKETAERWLFDWQLDERLIRLAGDECREKAKKFNIGYIDKVLEHWRLDGLTTPEKVRAYREKEPMSAAKKRAAKNLDKPTSFDLDAYTEMVKNYRPVFKKQG